MRITLTKTVFNRRQSSRRFFLAYVYRHVVHCASTFFQGGWRRSFLSTVERTRNDVDWPKSGFLFVLIRLSFNRLRLWVESAWLFCVPLFLEMLMASTTRGIKGGIHPKNPATTKVGPTRQPERKGIKGTFHLEKCGKQRPIKFHRPNVEKS